MVNLNELGWLAGIADGEGSFYLSNTVAGPKGNPVVKYSFAIGNTNRPMMMEVQRIVSEIVGHEINWLPIKQGSKQLRAAYLLQVTSRKDLALFCNAIIPYLVAKKEQAKVMLEFIQIRPRGRNRFTGRNMDADEKRQVLVAEMRRLNHLSWPHDGSAARDLTASPLLGVKEKSELHGDVQMTAETSVTVQ